MHPRLSGVPVDPSRIPRAPHPPGIVVGRATPEALAIYAADLAALPLCRMPADPAPRPSLATLIFGASHA